MDTRHGHLPFFWPTLALALLLGCGSAAGDDISSVCPDCTALSGETTDFSQTPCEAITVGIAVSDAEATALGFDVEAIRDRTTRHVDAPLHWQSQEVPQGAPADGYEAETRVAIDVQPGAMTYFRPDPTHCPEGECSLPGDSMTFPADGCSTRLHIGFDIELSTADGAITASGSGETVRFTEGDGIPAEVAAMLQGHASIDLTEVTGSLGLYPEANGPHAGTLSIELELLDAANTTGKVIPSIMYGGQDDNGLYRQLYSPLVGSW